MDITSENEMNLFINKYNYLVVFPDKKPKLYKSLRDIEVEISVAASTISKKLKCRYFFIVDHLEHLVYLRFVLNPTS